MKPLWAHFFREPPLAAFEPEDSNDMEGWGSTSPAFRVCIERVQPKLIIEVGSWKGASAVHMASLCDAEILCVDTWLGSFEMHAAGGAFFDSLRFKHGWPHLYYTFATNIVRHGLKDRVCPLPLPSTVAAALIKHKGLQADLIYIDGSHEYQDVKADILNYWPLLRSGGVLFGDDYHAPDVTRAVRETLADVGYATHEEKFMAVKP